MSKNISDDKMDEMLKYITESLNDVFDGIADVSCIKCNSDELMGQMMSTFMDYPIIKIEVSRQGLNIGVSKCNIEDVVEVLPKTIGSLLGLVPEQYRNDILYKAIQVDMTKNGGLQDRADEKDD